MKILSKHLPILKVIYFFIGLLFTTVGLIGIMVPGLPTTIFMILAATCFARSSQSMYSWLTNHPLFGESILRYRRGEGMPVKAKYTSISLMWIFIALSVFFFLHQSALWIKITIVLLGLIGTTMIIMQPTYNS